MATKQTEQKPYDITKEGPASYRDLQRANNEGYSRAVQQYGADAFKPRHQYNFENISPYVYEGGEQSSLINTTTPLGESVWDKESYTPDEWENLSDVRAESQPWWSQIGAGIAKGAVLAGTTFADGVVGTFAGIANVLANDNKQGAFNAFIDNPFSRAMQQINNAVEELLPNYYTQAELEEPWYKNIATANFIGDKFLKNLGFTIGAAYAGRVNAGMMSKVMGLGKVREAFKGAVVNSAGRTLNSSDEIAKAYLTGDAFMDGVKLTEDLAQAAKQMKRADMVLKTFGAVTSAMGEGRIEAIQGSNEWYKLNSQMLEDAKNQQLQEAYQALMSTHPEMFVLDENGNPVLADPRGQAMLQSLQDSINEKYEMSLAKLNDDKAKMANVIFSLNVPLLSGSNIFQFGRFMSGGYTAGRLSNSLVKGKLGEAIANKLPQRLALARALGSPLMEAQEEMSQQWIQEIPGAKYGSELNSFYGAKINPDAEEETIGWMKAVGTGFLNSYGDMKQWEQGFIGALTGALGAPRIHLRNKEGKFSPSITNEGELYEGLREYSELKKQAQEITDALNTSDFKNYYQGFIRHHKFQRDMDASLDKGDKFGYKNAESSQILSDAIMFNKAGRLQELYNEIESAGSISLEDVNDLRESVADKKTGKSFLDGMTDQEVVDFVKQQADGVKATLDRYVQTSNDLKTLYGNNVDNDVLEEMTWMLNQVGDWESRGKALLDEIRAPLQNKSKILKDRFGIDIGVVLNTYDDFAKAFIGDDNLVDRINGIIQNKNLTIQEQRNQINEAIRTKTIAKSDTGLKLGREIQHIRKKAREKLAEVKKLAGAYAIASEQGAAANTLNDIHRQYGQALSELQRDFNQYYFDENGNSREDNEGLGRELAQQIELLQSATVSSEYAQNLRGAIRDLENSAYRFMEQQYLIESGQWAARREALARQRQQEEANKLRLEITNLSYLLDDRDSQLVDPLQVQQISEKFTDLIKIVAARSKFIQDYNNLSKNPEAFTNTAVEEMNKASEAIQEREANKTAESILGAKSVKDIKNIIESRDANSISKAFEKIKKSEGNDEVKAVINSYEKLKTFDDIITEILKSTEASPATLSAANIIKDAITSANSEEEALNIINEYLNGASNAKEVKDAINEVLAKRKELEDSKKATKRDPNKPRKKGITDGLEDESKPADTPKKRKYSIMDAVDAGTDAKPEELKTEDAPDGTKATINNDNISDYLNDLDDEILKGLTEGKYATMEVFANSQGVTADEDISDEDTFNAIKEEAKEILEARAKEDKPKKAEKKAEPPKKETKKVTLKSSDAAEIDVKNPIEVVQALDDNSLRKIANGEATLNYMTAEEAALFQKLAQKELENRKNPNVHYEEGEEDDGNSEDDEYNEADALRSWAVSQYEFNPLKDRDERKAVVYDDPRTKALQKLGAYEFVDNGSLGILYNDNNDLEIHFVYATDDEALNGIPLLAVEITEDVEDLVSPINPITIGGKRYQIVGSLGFNAANETSTKTFRFISSRMSREYQSSDKDDNESYWLSNMHTQIKHFYSGRMVKSDETNKVADRPLRDVLKDEKPHFGIYYSDGDFRTPSLDQNREFIVPLNSNNANPREGSLWLMTREADGRYYAKSIKIARFDEYDLSTHQDSPIVQQIIEDLRIIADPTKSVYDRSIAKLDLESLLYFPEEYEIMFNNNSVSIIGYENNIAEGEDLDTKVAELLDALQSPELSLRFNISPSRLSEEDYVSDLLNSDVLTTDLLYVHNVNASFDVYAVDTNGNPIIDNEFVATGHTGRRGINNSLSSTTIMLDGTQYGIDSEGNITDKEGNEITDQYTIDEVLFNKKIRDNEIQPLEGTNMYLGYHYDGSEFGIVRNKKVSEERLEELKDKHKNAKRKRLSREAIEEVNTGKKGKSMFIDKSDEDEIALEEGPKKPSKETFVDKSDEDEISLEDVISGKEDKKSKPKEMFKAKSDEDEIDLDNLSFEVEDDGPEDSEPRARQFLLGLEPVEEGPSIDDKTLARKIDLDSIPTFTRLAKSKVAREARREAGLSSVQEMIELMEKYPDKFPSIESIDTEEKMQSVLDNIRNKCYLQ